MSFGLGVVPAQGLFRDRSSSAPGRSLAKPSQLLSRAAGGVPDSGPVEVGAVWGTSPCGDAPRSFPFGLEGLPLASAGPHTEACRLRGHRLPFLRGSPTRVWACSAGHQGVRSTPGQGPGPEVPVTQPSPARELECDLLWRLRLDAQAVERCFLPCSVSVALPLSRCGGAGHRPGGVALAGSRRSELRRSTSRPAPHAREGRAASGGPGAGLGLAASGSRPGSPQGGTTGTNSASPFGHPFASGVRGRCP